MRMPRHTLKLLVLLTVFSVTPVAAEQRDVAAGSQHHAAECPYARARAAAARSAELQPQAPARIILIERVPADTSALTLESGSFPTP
jgi:carotenoid cleavage dioxygenase-like enzyme